MQPPNITAAAAAWRNLGALAFLDDTEEALAGYKRATELEPANSQGWNQLGHLYDRAGQLDDAIAAYQEVVALGEANDERELLASGYGNLGTVHQIRGQLDEAENMYHKALEVFIRQIDELQD